MRKKAVVIGKIINGFEILDSFYKRSNNSGHTYYIVKCQKCGFISEKLSSHLKNGKSKCACRNLRLMQGNATKHGLSQSRLYSIMRGMKARCYYEKFKSYKNYGGRGIKICDEWKNDFQAFYDWAMANGYEDHLTIDRINVNGNYEPSNCRWITNEAQQKNKRYRKASV